MNGLPESRIGGNSLARNYLRPKLQSLQRLGLDLDRASTERAVFLRSPPTSHFDPCRSLSHWVKAALGGGGETVFFAVG